MSNKVTTMVPVDRLTDLGHDWRVIAFRPDGSPTWNWNINFEEVRIFQQSVRDMIVTTAQRRDPDGTRLLARLASKF